MESVPEEPCAAGVPGSKSTTDTRERTWEEEALRASELRYRRLFESAKDGILILDAETGMVVDVNPFLIKLLGFSYEAVRGKRIWDLGFFNDIIANQASFAELQQNEYIRYEDKQLETADGHRIDVEFVGDVYLVNHQKVIQCNIRDITERKHAAAVQRESERFAQATIDALPAHLCVLDETGRILTVNQAWRNFAKANQAVEQNVSEGANYLAVCDAGTDQESIAFAAGIRAVISGERQKYSLEYPCHSSTERLWFMGRVTRFASGGFIRVIVEHENITASKATELQLREQNEILSNSKEGVMIVNLSNEVSLWNRGAEESFGWTAAEALGHPPEKVLGIVDPGIFAMVRVAVERDGFWNGELRTKTRDGRELVVSCRTSLVRDAKGLPRARLSFLADVTESKLLEKKFLRAQRLEAIGTLSGGIAHDLNNILAPMLLFAPFLQDKLSDPKDRELLTMIEQGAQRAANIIKQLLTFSRGIGGERGPVQTRHLIKEMTALMRETFPREIEVVEKMPANLWPVNADATQIHQVLMNLCVNARDAIHVSGKITLAAENLVIGKNDAALPSSATPGAYVRLTVTDTGEGIPRADIDRIFEPFFTTKEIGKGTGLGLSTVLGIVKSHGGFVTVCSEPGNGTAFKVYLPAIAGATDNATPAAPPSRRGRQELILIVDDEAAIRHALRLALEQNNYRVLDAADGREAIDHFLVNRGNVRLVLTDIMMPGMNGAALIRTLRALEPRLRVIAVSGLHDQDRREELVALGVMNTLSKPCSADEILEVVQHELAET
jgi:PAS domain S-box-containing protein